MVVEANIRATVEGSLVGEDWATRNWQQGVRPDSEGIEIVAEGEFDDRSRVDPVRVGNLLVEGPQPRPVVGIPKEDGRNFPECVTRLDHIGIRKTGDGIAGLGRGCCAH